ncbi:hypothetical protein HOLleu_21041 [Holothuria leucospilota]|uniref:Uncharacterized protein n=1 Tax=Holothuria leucospilota TaxID=206669 RepID=A0A9Q1H6J3_HOLLE|nr:hypothetical protein HOLleu_21041 [Holothuria leucospilota]
MLLCFNTISKKAFASKFVDVGPSESVLIASLDNAANLQNKEKSMRMALHDEVFVSGVSVMEKSIKKFNGYSGKEGFPIFAKIRLILAFEVDVTFKCELWHGVEFARHYHASVVKPTDAQELIFISA